MNRARLYRKSHSIIGLIIAIFLAKLAITGLGLNHPEWLRASKAPVETSLWDAPVQTLATDPSAAYLLVATRDGLFYSKDAGASFEALPMKYDTKGLKYISVLDDGTVYLGYRFGIILSTQLGVSPLLWERLILPQSAGPLKALTASMDQGVWVDTSSGAFRWDPSQDRWIQLSERDASLYQVFHDLHTGQLFKPWHGIANDMTAVLVLVLIASGLYLAIKSRKKKR